MAAWYEKGGNADDVVISTRARLARNIKGFPYSPKLNKDGAQKIVALVDDALSRAHLDNAEFIDFSSLSDNKANSYFEKHYISSDFLSAVLPKQLVLSEEMGMAIMINEEDHLRIQSIVSGFDIEKAFDTADKIDSLLSESIEFDFDEKLGYLTKCPTNLGTGLRLSVMMHLPALTMTKQMAQILKIAPQLGFTVRGFYGEGSKASGYLYQISNQETLGFSEAKLCEKMNSFVSQLIDRERNARTQMYNASPMPVEDMVYRAEGALRYARLMSAKEFVDHYSALRLGISLGICENIKNETLNKLLIETAPHTLFQDSAALPGEGARDKARAEYIRSLL